MAKQAWQVTRDEYVALFKGQRIKKTGFQNRLGTLHNAHRDEVAIAEQGGRAIPENVLADYPEILAQRAFVKSLHRISSEAAAFPK